MDIALFSLDGLLFILRWLHFFWGIVWIGMLYYFNFVQGAFFNETDASTKSNAIQKLVPRALWWFRYGALWTIVTGLAYFMLRGHRDGHAIFMTSWGVLIMTGMILGICMFLNVWLIIWPNQKIVIASATAAATGGTANPAAAAAGARAGIASRHNVLFSIPLLFFMGAASHLPLGVAENSKIGLYFLAVLVVVGALELNAIKGKMGPLTKISGVIHMGFLLTIVMYVMAEVIL